MLRTPQQNGVVERKNRSLQVMARTMLNDETHAIAHKREDLNYLVLTFLIPFVLC